MRQSTTLLQLQALHTCLFLSVQLEVTLQQGGHMTMAGLSGKGHGKNVGKRSQDWSTSLKNHQEGSGSIMKVEEGEDVGLK